MDVYPEVFDYIKYFDKFLCFVKEDVEKYKEYNLSVVTNFYFDYPLIKNILPKNALYFVGTHIESRSEKIQIFLEKAESLNLNIDFYLSGNIDKMKKFFKNSEKIHYIDSSYTINFEDNLYNVKANLVIVDFLNEVHQGLSFRFFEALLFDKKLITTNPTIKNYDFYHPNNIFIWNGVDLSGLEEFLALPYQPIAKKIKDKYSFTQWITRVLE